MNKKKTQSKTENTEDTSSGKINNNLQQKYEYAQVTQICKIEKSNKTGQYEYKKIYKYIGEGVDSNFNDSCKNQTGTMMNIASLYPGWDLFLQSQSQKDNDTIIVVYTFRKQRYT